MKAIAINGGPRKQWNTATLLEKALEGAREAGMETELVHLYDLDFKGCISCFACKLKDGPSCGRCAVGDGLRPLLEEISGADALLFGSPIYLGNVTGEMRSFMERLVFQYLQYSDPTQSLFGRKIKTGLICTMNVTEELARNMDYAHCLGLISGFLSRTFGSCETLLSYDTLPFSDYSRYVVSRSDPALKVRRRSEIFPQDCRKAFELGRRLV